MAESRLLHVDTRGVEEGEGVASGIFAWERFLLCSGERGRGRYQCEE